MAWGSSGKSANEGYVAIGLETVTSTYNTCTSALELLSGAVQPMIESGKAESISRRRGYTKRYQTIKSFEGTFEYYFTINDMANMYMLHNACGGTITTSTVSAGAAYSHVFDVGGFEGTFSSICINQRIGSDSNHVFEISGARTNEFKLTAEIGEPLRCSSSIVGHTWTKTSNDVASVLTMSSLAPLMFHEGAVTYSAASMVVTKAEITINNNLFSGNEMRAIGDMGLSGAAPPGKRDITVSLSMRWDTTTAYDAYVAASSAALQLTFTGPTIPGASSTYSLVIDIPKVFFNKSFPELGGPNEILSQDIECDALVDDPNTATGHDIRFTVQNDLATIP